MKSTFYPAKSLHQEITYPAYRVFNDESNPKNLLNGAVVLFPTKTAMVMLHTPPSTEHYKQGRIYCKDLSDLFIPADDEMFQEAKGNLIMEF